MKMRIVNVLTETASVIIVRRGNKITVFLDRDKWIIRRSIGVKNENIVLIPIKE
jgi:hypothetical protein